jgi:hypothetical protein
MKKFALLTIACATALSAFAQSVEFIEPRNVQGVAMPEYQTFRVKDYTYVLYKQFSMQSPILHNLQLDAYDANLKPIGSNTIDKTLDPGDANMYEGIYALTDKLVMFKSEFNKGEGMTLFYYPFTSTGARQAGTELVNFPAEKAMNSGNFKVAVSDDGSKIAVLCELPYVKDSVEHDILYVFDNSFKELWHMDFRFPYEGGKAPFNDIYVNNNGVVFNMKQVPVKKAFDFYSMFTFNGTTMKESKIDLGQDGHIATYKTGFFTNGDLYLGGYSYTDKKVGINVDTPTHTFAVKVSAADGSLPVDKVSEIPMLGSIKATQVIVQSDNTTFLIGEHQYTASTPRPNLPGQYDYENQYSDITVMKFGADGSKLWSYSVDKDTKSFNDGGKYLSYAAFVMNGNLVITYRDHLYRHDGKEHKVVGPILLNQFVNVFLTLNQDGGKIKESYIIDPRMGGEKGEYFLISRTGVKVNENTLFFVGGRGLELVGIKVTL